MKKKKKKRIPDENSWELHFTRVVFPLRRVTEPEPVREYFEIQGEALEEFWNLPQAGAASPCRPSLDFPV